MSSYLTTQESNSRFFRVVRVVVVLLSMTTVAGCRTHETRSCVVDPEIFCGPFSELAAELPARTHRELLALPRQDRGKLHFGLGMHVRNRFGLWQDNALTRYFIENGIDHADEMSAPFIDGFVGYLRGESVDMNSLLEGYKVSPAPPPPADAESSTTGLTGRANNSSTFKH